ncbi:hypothetical protein GGX14DRAFT_402789 [Mycena pura]|uniref:Uncharacterized protein n=1 Tax=Mycena pura TaxID=153505 RepID=A0AAD6UX82_9AGAR|nr:hypothetical protein GGX14DRAFT_402789 [Mycena pura]
MCSRHHAGKGRGAIPNVNEAWACRLVTFLDSVVVAAVELSPHTALSETLVLRRSGSRLRAVDTDTGCSTTILVGWSSDVTAAAPFVNIVLEECGCCASRALPLRGNFGNAMQQLEAAQRRRRRRVLDHNLDRNSSGRMPAECIGRLSSESTENKFNWVLESLGAGAHQHCRNLGPSHLTVRPPCSGLCGSSQDPGDVDSREDRLIVQRADVPLGKAVPASAAFHTKLLSCYMQYAMVKIT